MTWFDQLIYRWALASWKVPMPSSRFICRACGRVTQSTVGRKYGVCGPHFLCKPRDWWDTLANDLRKVGVR